MTSKSCRSVVVAVAALLGGVKSAEGQPLPALLFETEVVSLDLDGTGTLPLGENGANVLTQVSGSRAQNHNSSRSNRTSLVAFPDDPNDGDDVNPNELDGVPFELLSDLNVLFDLTFTDIDPVNDFDRQFGDTIAATLSEPIDFALEPASFIFDADAPDFGMLRSAGPPRHQFRGHVTVLKIALGSGGDVDVPANGIALGLTPGTDVYIDLGGGVIEHEVGFTLDLSGTLNGRQFSLSGIGGTLVERGMLFNNIVPEPSAMAVLVLYAAGAATRRDG